MDSNPPATPQDTIAALRARYTGELAVAGAATPGPWFAHIGETRDPDSYPFTYMSTDEDGEDCDIISGAGYCGPADTHFIAAARESVPRDARMALALLEQLERWIVPDEHRGVQWEYASAATTILRLLAESAGEAVAW